MGKLPLRGADWRKEEAAFGGAPAARGCPLEQGGRSLFLGELPLRGAAGLQTGGCCSWGSSRCAGLLDRRKEEAALGGAPAARGCPLEQGGRRLVLGELRCAGLLEYREEEAALGGAPAAQGCPLEQGGRSLFLGELPLRGAAGLQTGGCCSWGSSRCAGLLDRRKEEAALGGAPAARGCPLEQGGRRLFLGELPLRGAAGIQRRGGCSWGSSRCAGLPVRAGREESLSGGAPAARGCWITDRRMLLLGELPLRRAARSEEGRSCFGGSSRCAGLPVRAGREEALSGGAPAARGCWNTEKRRLLLGELPLRRAAR